MHEVVNVQTRVDKTQMDVKHPILQVLNKKPLLFIQLYVDSPHCRFNLRYLHPVSGSIVLCDLQHPHTKDSMLKVASDYIDRVRDVCLKMQGQLSSRLEYVTYIDKSAGIPTFLRAQDFLRHPGFSFM